MHEILERVADKWTLLVIDALADGGGVMRFSALRQAVSGVSQKMLTKTVRQLERDGLVTRTIHPVVPPRVDYTLTALGHSLGEAVCAIWTWAEDHVEHVQRARKTFDRKRARVA